MSKLITYRTLKKYDSPAKLYAQLVNMPYTPLNIIHTYQPSDIYYNINTHEPSYDSKLLSKVEDTVEVLKNFVPDITINQYIQITEKRVRLHLFFKKIYTSPKYIYKFFEEDPLEATIASFLVLLFIAEIGLLITTMVVMLSKI